MPSCLCPVGYIGDPFSSCYPEPQPPRKNLEECLSSSLKLPALPPAKPIALDDPCHPTPCGANALCQNGQCSCLAEYQGDPYSGCRPECVLNADCPRNRACVRHKCVDPCPGTCAPNAICDVINHLAMCRCPERMIGNAFIQCEEPPVSLAPIDPCYPSPCGQIAAAECPTTTPCALASRITLEPRPTAGRSAPRTRIACLGWPASGSTAWIRVPELVASMPCAMW